MGRETIAELELYGLSVRSINWLEDKHGLLWIDELEDLTVERMSRHLYYDQVLRELRCALANYVAGRPVKTAGDCLVF